MGETIVLPMSGVVLTRGCSYGEGTLQTWDWKLVGLSESTVARDCGERWVAWWADSKTHWGTRETILAWLDARVLKTRAALTPPGHVVVGPDARERVARALADAIRMKEPDSEEYEEADAVLRALGVRG